LIQESIKHQDREVYLGASKLLKTAKERKTKFVNQLRSKIILDSPWSINFYHKIEKINSELNTEIHDYFEKKMDAKESAAREQKLNHLINQLNFCFYDSSTNLAKFSYLTQNIYR
jgi:predicted metal-dependent hydrolase